MKKFLNSSWFAALIGALSFAGTFFYMYTTQSALSKSQAPASSGATNNPASTNLTAEVDAHAAPVVPAAEHEVPPAAKTPLPSFSSIASPGEFRFNNPEVAKLMAELDAEKHTLAEEKRKLDELQLRLKAEKAEIGMITQEVYQAKMTWEKSIKSQVQRVAAEDQAKLQALARIYTNMPPTNCVIILKTMPAEEVAKIFLYMTDKDLADRLGLIAKEPDGAMLAAEISQRLRTLSKSSE
jgi:flagellar motility protein MotE (MotC chaperone)